MHLRSFAGRPRGRGVSAVLKRIHVLVPCLVILLIPGASWAFYKPVRVLAPELNGVTCVDDIICMEDVSRYEEASKLYDEAFAFVNTTVDELEEKPRVFFCSSQDCFDSFGFNRTGAHTVGISGIVVGPRGWKDYNICATR